MKRVFWWYCATAIAPLYIEHIILLGILRSQGPSYSFSIMLRAPFNQSSLEQIWEAPACTCSFGHCQDSVWAPLCRLSGHFSFCCTNHLGIGFTALYLTFLSSVGECHFRTWTQRVTFEPWDLSNMWSEWCHDDVEIKFCSKRVEINFFEKSWDKILIFFWFFQLP